jgi:CHASE2 domain-containing sensor protein
MRRLADGGIALSNQPASQGSAEGHAAAGSGPTSPQERERRTLFLLNQVRWIAIVDALLLVPLLWATFTRNEDVIDVLGPIHGIGFLVLMGLVGIGALNKLWGWWFPIITLVTAGPLGSLIGEWRVRKGVVAAQAARGAGPA